MFYIAGFPYPIFGREWNAICWRLKEYYQEFKWRANTSTAFDDQAGVENVMAANSLVLVENLCDGSFMRWKRA